MDSVITKQSSRNLQMNLYNYTLTNYKRKLLKKTYLYLPSWMIPVFHYTWGKKASNNHKNKQTKNKQLVAKYKLNVQKKLAVGKKTIM